MDASTLAALLKEAEEHHGAYEAVAPTHHWWDWYAPYIVARADGRTVDEAVADAGLHMEVVLR
ncbi:bleomycin resistance protein [Cryptosporangium minutisporangium]|uniref:Bleomycin resistance protein n=1 Tax=Cryptosporangium minutisporangium TaxID=113569 RepID=A0ABP6SRH5_9ACTN